MKSSSEKKAVIRNTLSNYMRTIVRIGLGFVTFRLLFQHLSAEQYGFWALLWAVFGYGILLDFGFGYSAQKRVAELSVKQDWPQLSRVLSTIFFFYCLGALVAVSLGILFSSTLIEMFKVSAEHREEYRHILVMFLIGIGIAFPFGIFPEVLQGQQRASVWNTLFIIGTVVNFFIIVSFVVFHYSFLLLVMLSLLSFLLPYIIAAVLSLKYLPGVSIRPDLFAWNTIVETSKFSLFAYANTLGNILRNKTDQPVISMLLGVAYLKPYLAGSKSADIYDAFARQIADALAPTAAHLHAKGDQLEFQRILIRGMRFSVLIGTPIYVLSAIYMDGIVRLLTGVKHPTGPMIWTGELLVFWYYSQVMTHTVFKNMAMMAGQEKRMMQQSIAESGLNLVLSVGLTWWIGAHYGVDWGILGVALGSVVPTFLFGWGWLWGRAATAAGLSYQELFRRVIWRNWAACLPMLAVVLVFRLQPLWASGSNTLLVLVEGGIAGAIGLWGNWKYALDDFERRDYAQRFGGKFKFKKSRT